MRSSAAPQPHCVESGSCRNTVRGKCAGSGVRRGVRGASACDWRGRRTALTQGLEFGLDGGQVGVDRFVEQAGLLRVDQAFTAGGELDPSQHGDLVRELVDLGLTELEFLVLGLMMESSRIID